MARPLTTRNLLTLVLILVVGTLSVLALLSYRKWEPESTFESIPENIDLTLRKIKYSKTRDGETLWNLLADSAAHSMADGITRITNVKIVFFDADLGNIVLTADQGELIPQKKIVTVYSNVTVTSPPGNVMHTEYLEYKEVTNSLHTDKAVRIDFVHFKVRGTGMQMDLEKRLLVLLSNVKARLGV